MKQRILDLQPEGTDQSIVSTSRPDPAIKSLILSSHLLGLALYEQALLHHPRHAEALYNMAVAYGESRQLRKAALMYEMTLVVSPGCAEAHNNLGVIHRELNNYTKAMQCYLAALQVKPDFPEALNNVAVIYTSQVRKPRAPKTFVALMTRTLLAVGQKIDRLLPVSVAAER